MKKIAILTSGGDAPGMNAAIAGFFDGCKTYNLSPIGVVGGYQGLLDSSFIRLYEKDIKNNAYRGGTFLKTKRVTSFAKKEIQQQAANNLKAQNINTLCVIGGDGSFKGAQALSKFGINVVCIPASIDNDLNYSDYSIGFSTAVNTVIDASNKIADTMYSHSRFGIVEVMGKNDSYIANFASASLNPVLILSNENNLTLDDVYAKLQYIIDKGIDNGIIVMAESYSNKDKIVEYLTQKGIESRKTILGHIQRGGNPSEFDFNLAFGMGELAALIAYLKLSNQAIFVKKGIIESMSLTKAINSNRQRKFSKKEMKSISEVK